MAARLTAYLVVAIVSVTLIAGLIVGAQRDDSDGPVDLIVQNATVYTADGHDDTAEAIAVRGNQVLRVGSNREIARLKRPQTIVVDARGGAVVPGFNDAGLDLGRAALAGVNVADAATAAGVLERIAAWSAENPDRPWVVGRGWSPDQFRTGPSRQQLDAVVADRPAAIFSADGHSLWLNSPALARAGISRRTPEPADGAIVRDPRTGEPSGVLRGAAAARAAALIPPLTAEQRADAMRAVIAEANARGVTSAQTTGDAADTLEVFDGLRRSGDLTLRVYSAVPVRKPLTDAALAELEAVRKEYPDDPLLKAGALSIALDGPIAEGAAALLEPSEGADATNATEQPVAFDPDDLNRTVRLADAAGWQVMIHASGDRAARLALNAYAHAVRSNRLPPRGRRHRIENVALIDEADLPRFDLLGVTASMRPSQAGPSEADIERLVRQIGEARAARAFAFRSLGEATRLIFGSGWPDYDLDPLRVLQAASMEEPTADTSEEPAGRLELPRAIDAYTSTPAWASFDDQRKGSIAPGMLADLVVLSEDIFAAPANLATASVSVTIFDGKIVYRVPARAETPPAPATAQ